MAHNQKDIAIVLAPLACLTWGVLAFGSVYSWAYWPLIVAAFIAGGASVLRAQVVRSGSWRVAALLIAPVGVQLMPLPFPILQTVAASNAKVAADLRLGYDTAGSWHSISVDPLRTLTCLLFVTAGILWVHYVANTVSSRRANAAACASYLIWLGVGLTAIALAQRATGATKLYWLWQPESRVWTNYFGPFVNRNHFAGWTILALSLGCGYLAGLIAELPPPAGRGLRCRLLWLGTPAANRVMVTFMGLCVLIVGQLWSRSRSGIAATLLVMLALAIVAIIRNGRSLRGLILSALLATVFVGPLAWRGSTSILRWYSQADAVRFRVGLWEDSLPALADFWLCGSGLNTYGRAMLTYHQRSKDVQAFEAHNDYLQLAIEGGVLVGIPWCAAAIIVGRWILVGVRARQSEMTWWIRIGALFGMAGIAIQEMADFSMQVPGVALLCVTACGLAIHCPAPTPNKWDSDVPRRSRSTGSRMR